MLVLGFAPGTRAAEAAAPGATVTNTTEANPATSGEDGELDYHVRLDEEKSRFNLGVYVTGSQFAFQGRSLVGNSLELDANYALNPRLVLSVGVAQAITVTGGISVLYTGIRASVGRSFWGSFIRHQSTVVINGQRSLQTTTGTTSLLAGDVGAEQFVFNGTTRVVPATGASAGIRYDRTFGSFRASLMARYGMLLISAQSATMMLGGAGLIYSF